MGEKISSAFVEFHSRAAASISHRIIIRKTNQFNYLTCELRGNRLPNLTQLQLLSSGTYENLGKANEIDFLKI